MNSSPKLCNAARARAPQPSFGMLAGWLTLLVFLVTAHAQQSQDPEQPAAGAPRPLSLSVISTNQLADWQKRLTLGPGDQLDVSLYAQADTARAVLIGPDGRFNYLQAEDVMAAGLTIDELRAKLEETLGKFYLSPRAIIVPSAYNSKKFYVMGNVAQKGVFPLERPVTIVEAVATARGFTTLASSRGIQPQADLARSFLIRQFPDGSSRRMDVDFEGLFVRGDLAQNIPVAPEDYLYFPPIELQEIYVLGEVARPGTISFGAKMSVLQAVASAGGFTDAAYRTHVLVVRGSLRTPETFVVNARDVLRAKNVDFPLRAKDIIYVARRPWSKAEELLEAAVTDFFRAAIITWTGRNVGPFITSPIID